MIGIPKSVPHIKSVKKSCINQTNCSVPSLKLKQNSEQKVGENKQKKKQTAKAEVVSFISKQDLRPNCVCLYCA